MFRPVAASVAAVLLVLVSACSQFEAPEKRLAAAVSEASSATASGQMVIHQRLEQRTTKAVTKAALTDILEQLDKASESMTSIGVDNRRQLDLRSQALATLADARKALFAAQASVEEATDAPKLAATEKDVANAPKALKELEKRLPSQR